MEANLLFIVRKGVMKIYHGFEGPWVIEIGRMVV